MTLVIVTPNITNTTAAPARFAATDPNRNVFQNSHKIVILRACDFFDLYVFSACPTSCISSPLTKPSS